MVSLSCTATREDGVTLVTGHVRNTGRPRRVRLANQLDGPVWPPRSSGVPAAGWDEDTLECVLAAGDVRAIGYATPAEPAPEPMTVVTTEPADVDAESAIPGSVGTHPVIPEIEGSTTGVIRSLGSPRPPRDAVPTPEVGRDDDTATPSASRESTDAAASSAGRLDTDDQRAVAGTRPDAAADVDTAEAWLDAVEQRLAAVETLSAAARVDAATTAVARLGGLEAVRELETELADDAARLRTITTRAERLADRAEAVEVPVDTLERLA